MKPRDILAALAGSALLLLDQSATAATLFLRTGAFYGPGDRGVHPFNNAQIRNIQLNSSFQGIVPFFNNGGQLPNTIAEGLHGLPIDGLTSDGRAINENIDTGLHLTISDRETGESANMIVVSVAEETIAPDERGNVVFTVHVVADPGQASLVVPMVVHFTSGSIKVPLSLKTQMGVRGGHDTAGPFPSGRVLIGRLGDFDHDGLLDGELVQTANAPLELIVARGDPQVQRRTWISDIPAPPPVSAFLNLNGIVQNFPAAMSEALGKGQLQTAVEYGFDITGRLNAAIFDLSKIQQSSSSTRIEKARARAARSLVRVARVQMEHGLDQLFDANGREERVLRAGALLQSGLKTLGVALLQLAPDRSQSPGSFVVPNRSEEDAGLYASELIQRALADE